MDVARSLKPPDAADARAQASLAHALARDVDAAFEAFVGRYQDRLFGFVLTLVGSRADAEDIAQDTFVSAYGALLRYDAERRQGLALRAWLFTIALNKVRNRARRAPALALDESAAFLADPSAGPPDRAEQAEAVATVRRALGALAPRYRMPVVLRHIEGLSYAEIAHVLQQPVGTAKANVHRGLALLRAAGDVGALAS
jgi:RNA polymerase sigma-70 factor (ECF subfamily)